MEAGRGAYCNPIHDRAHGVHAHRDWGQSEQSCPLPQTRRRSEGKERTAGAAGRGNERERDILSVEEREREREEGSGHRRACFSEETQFAGGERRGCTFIFSRSVLRTHAGAASSRRSCVIFCARTNRYRDSMLRGKSMGFCFFFNNFTN